MSKEEKNGLTIKIYLIFTVPEKVQPETTISIRKSPTSQIPYIKMFSKIYGSSNFTIRASPSKYAHVSIV